MSLSVKNIDRVKSNEHDRSLVMKWCVEIDKDSKSTILKYFFDSFDGFVEQIHMTNFADDDDLCCGKYVRNVDLDEFFDNN